MLSHENTFGSSVIFPPTLGRTPQFIKDQGLSDYCTSAARSAMASYYFGKEMSFEYQTAKEGEQMGTPIYNGAQPNLADEASVSYGFLPDEQCPLKFTQDGWIKPAEWQNYPPALDGQAITKNVGQPFDVSPDYASIKSALLQGQADNAVVIVNGFWYNEWNNPMDGIVPTPTSSPLTRHDYLLIDWKTIGATEYLVAQLSQGSAFGDGGTVYMSQEAVTAAFKNPVLNGVGCEIFRKGTGQTPVQLEISKLQQCVQLLGEILTLIKLKI
jgi:hypothetical protein